jgi:hypothetical protein
MNLPIILSCILRFVKHRLPAWGGAVFLEEERHGGRVLSEQLRFQLPVFVN